MDEFTYNRLTRLIDSYKQKNGRDISESEVIDAGFDKDQLQSLVRRGVVDKYQVTAAKGNTENRYKLHKDWRSLNKI